ncbi:MAG: rod shape-determining protein MreC [Tunicatimonas sp.]
MHNLLSLFLKYRASVLFVLLEGISTSFIVNTNTYHRAAVVNTSNYVVASVLETSNTLSTYFGLESVNEQLAEENARLRQAVASQRTLRPIMPTYLSDDSLARRALAQDSVVLLPNKSSQQDSLRYQQYAFLPARVVDNTVNRAKNYVTISQGRADGIRPNMGVISPTGVVGKVQDVSEHYALITSVLHTDMFMSALVKRSNTLGSLQWNGRDSRTASLTNIPIHINIIQGDSIVTSGYSGIYPPGIPIGTVAQVRPEEDAAFYTIDVDLATNFYQLGYVYVVNNTLKHEKDSLVQKHRFANE